MILNWWRIGIETDWPNHRVFVVYRCIRSSKIDYLEWRLWR
jgi:hypothetical protein